jgi:hypothetical protein
VGVFDSPRGNLSEEWRRSLKTAAEENRTMVGLIILSLHNCNVENVRCPYIVIPEKLCPTEIFAFL